MHGLASGRKCGRFLPAAGMTHLLLTGSNSAEEKKEAPTSGGFDQKWG